MADIKRMLFMEQPLPLQYDDGTPCLLEVEEPTLEYIYQFMYDNDDYCSEPFKRALKENPKQDINDLMASIIDQNIYHEHTQNCVLAATHHWMKIMSRRKKKVPDVGNKLWLLTFTLGTTPNDSETNLKEYVLKQLKKYKFMYTEERGGQNGRYHIHAIVEGEYFHRKKNLRPTKKNTGWIDHVIYGYDNDQQGKYLSKETPVKGDVAYIQNLIKKLRK